MKHATILVPVLAIAAVWLPQAARSEPVLCTEPLRPVCLDLDTTFQTGETTEACRADVDQYAKDVKDYAQCLAKAIKADEAEVKTARAELAKRTRQN